MAIEIFENVTDVIREAARIPQDRRLTNGWKDDLTLTAADSVILLHLVSSRLVDAPQTVS